MTFDNTNRGVLFTNNKKKSDKSPDYTGTINIDGEDKKISAWNKTSGKGTSFISISIDKGEYQKTESKPKIDRGSSHDPNLDDEIPF